MLKTTYCLILEIYFQFLKLYLPIFKCYNMMNLHNYHVTYCVLQIIWFVLTCKCTYTKKWDYFLLAFPRLRNRWLPQ